MPKFYVKKTSLAENSLIFKGKVIEGPINTGMILEIPLLGASDVIPVKIHEIAHYEKETDELKKIGLIADFYDAPDDLDVIFNLNIADEELNVCEAKNDDI